MWVVLCFFVGKIGAKPLEDRVQQVIAVLRVVNPSPYMFYLAIDESAVIGASPEMLVRVEDGNVESARQNGSIIMYDQHLKEVARWNFERGWPIKITDPQPKADSNQIGVEKLTIAHEYIERVK